MLNRPFAAAITGYQRYISPYKGFCCAYRVKHGGMSCSEYVKQALLQHGIWRAIPIAKQRFGECKLAASAVVADGNNQYRTLMRRQNRSRQQKRNSSLDCCNGCSPIDLIPSEGCGSFEIAGGGADACSCTPW